MTVRIITGDCCEELAALAAEGAQFHACVTDPPYHLIAGGLRLRTMQRNGDGTDRTQQSNYKAGGFMGQAWDGGDVAFRPETWRAVFDVLLPGAHLLAFGGTRGWHRQACAIEDAGFEIRDTLAWLYGSGFPKSLDVSKAIDKAAGAHRQVVGSYAVTRDFSDISRGRYANQDTSSKASSVDITAPATPEAEQWQGWGTALKPAFEPIIVARKPFRGSVAANILAHGCGALNIDASRVGTTTETHASKPRHERTGFVKGFVGGTDTVTHDHGRWPANLLHDGSDEVLAAFPDAPGQSGVLYNERAEAVPRGDTGTAARFFYTAKADASDRAGSKHPTVKPADLMRWLVRLVTPPGGTVLDPFAGTGSTGLAADQLGLHAVLIEQDAGYAADARRKLERDAGLFADVINA